MGQTKQKKDFVNLYLAKFHTKFFLIAGLVRYLINGGFFDEYYTLHQSTRRWNRA